MPVFTNVIGSIDLTFVAGPTRGYPVFAPGIASGGATVTVEEGGGSGRPPVTFLILLDSNMYISPEEFINIRLGLYNNAVDMEIPVAAIDSTPGLPPIKVETLAVEGVTVLLISILLIL